MSVLFSSLSLSSCFLAQYLAGLVEEGYRGIEGFVLVASYGVAKGLLSDLKCESGITIAAFEEAEDAAELFAVV